MVAAFLAATAWQAQADDGATVRRSVVEGGEAKLYAGSQFRELVGEVYASGEDLAARRRRLQPVLDFCEPMLLPQGSTVRVAVANDAQLAEFKASRDPSMRVEPVDTACVDAIATSAFLDVDEGKLDQAERRFKQAIQLGPYRAGPHAELGFIANARGARQQALAEYRQALALTDRYPEAEAAGRPVVLRGLGWTLVELGQYDEARAHYVEALALEQDPKNRERTQAEIDFIDEAKRKKLPPPNTGNLDTRLAQPTEREKVVAYSAALEANPLDGDADAKRSWLIQWITDAPDLEVVVCNVMGLDMAAAAAGDDKAKLRRATESVLLTQYMFGSASYQIQHPGPKPDSLEVQSAGVRSALRAYKALLAGNPAVARADLDALAKAEANGTLDTALAPAFESECRGK